MRVLYDVTVLGNAHRHRWQRTGVFRVVDEIARRLAVADECDLRFCCAIGSDVLEDCQSYLDSDPTLRRVPLVYSERAKRANGRLARLDKSISNAGGIGKVSLRALRKVVRRVPEAPTLTARDLAGADIFHAPAFYLPEGLPRAPRVEAFLTVYDLIPILHPQLCREGSREFVEKALAGLDHDRWAICISDATKTDLCNYLPSFDPDRAFVIPLAASEKFYPCHEPALQSAARLKYGIPDAPYFLSLSTLEPRKNIDHIIRCFGALAAELKVDDVNLVLVGEKGWDYESIFQTLAHHAELKRRIFLPGFVADEDLAPLYSGALAFVYPSLYEGFGLPPLEAMKSGTPVITSNVSSLPEVVADTGIMVSPSDADALCQAMLDIYRQPSLAAELANRGLRRANEFSWEKSTQATLAAYQTALRHR